MIAFSKMDISFGENENGPLNERKMAFVFSDMSDTNEVVRSFREAWNSLLDDENIKGEKKMTLKFMKLNEHATLPKYAHDGDSGMDLRTIDSCTIPSHGFCLLRSGIAADIPFGYELQVRPRSGLSAKNGVVCSFGTVDQGYRGDIGITLYNHNDCPYEVKLGDRVAQLVLVPVVRAEIEETYALSGTERGSNGFGSTGR